MAAPETSVATAKGRYYEYEGKRYISVTNVLDRGIPKPALVNWGPKMCAEFVADNLALVAETRKAPNGRSAVVDLVKRAPYRESDAARGLGSLIHDYAEARILGTPLPEIPPKHIGFVKSFDAFLADFDPVYEATEMSVFNDTYEYAGTLDFIARFNKAPELGVGLSDYKTTKPGQQGHGIYPETCLQLNAYANAEFAVVRGGGRVEMPPVDTLLGVNLRPDGYKVVPVEYSDAAFRRFLYAQQTAWMTDHGFELVGAPLKPPSQYPDRPTMPPNVSALVD